MRPEEKHDLQPFELDYWFCLFVCLLSSSNSFESCQFKKKKNASKEFSCLSCGGPKPSTLTITLVSLSYLQRIIKKSLG